MTAADDRYIPSGARTAGEGPALLRAAMAWPYLTYFLIVAAQTALSLDARYLWFSDEVRYGAALVELLDSDNWATLTLNGAPYPDKPPLYFWFLAAIAGIAGTTAPWIYFLGSAISGWAFICAGHFLVRRVLPDRPGVAFGTGLMLAATPYVAFLPQYVRMDLMFAACILVSAACFHTGVRRGRFSWWIVMAFVAATAASFIKGPLGHVLPLLACATDLVLSRRLIRFLAWDMLLGVLFSLAVAAAWFVAAIGGIGDGFAWEVLDEQIFQRAVSAWHHRHPFWYYIALLPVLWLPWTLLLAWPQTWRGIGHGLGVMRRRALLQHPAVYFGATWAVAFILLSALSGKIHIYLLPTMPAMAAMGVLVLTSMTPRARMLAWLAVAALSALAGIGAIVVGASDWLPFEVPGLIGLGGIMIGTGIVVALTHRLGVLLPLAAQCCGIVVLMNQLGLVVAPGVDPYLAPHDQAMVMRDYRAQGYFPVALGTYDGVYRYDFGETVFEIDTADQLEAVADEHGPLVVVMRRSTYANLPEWATTWPIVHEQRMAENVYVVIAGEKP